MQDLAKDAAARSGVNTPWCGSGLQLLWRRVKREYDRPWAVHAAKGAIIAALNVGGERKKFVLTVVADGKVDLAKVDEFWAAEGARREAS